jgi:dihydrodipicolinate synthase/N-acetylneuraminate lyase
MRVEKRNLMKLAGTVAPIITVFNDDELINEEKIIKHARWLIDNGVQGFVTFLGGRKIFYECQYMTV